VLIEQNYHDLDLTDGESNATSVFIDTRAGSDLSIWAVPTSASDPSSAVAEAFGCITNDAPAEIVARTTAAGTIDLTGATTLDLDVRKRSSVLVKITTPQADRSVRMYFALWNRSV
jgi:hypothetical protein